MIKIAICDDEKNIRTYLFSLVRKQDIECEIAEYDSAEEYLADEREHDILLLDIALKNNLSGMNGMMLARQIRSMDQKKRPIIIFVTGYEKYVYDAFDVEAFQYLLKPVNEQKFEEVFTHAVQNVLSNTQQHRKALIIQYESRNKSIPLDNIYYIKSQGHKAVLHMKDGILEYWAKMGDLETKLQGHFYRIHKGYLINLSWVDEYSKTEVTLINGERLLISKYKYRDFVKAYLRYME